MISNHILFILIILEYLAISCFLKGFFLTRNELGKISHQTIDPVQEFTRIMNSRLDSKPTAINHYDHIVWFIIDGLRSDFILPQDQKNEDNCINLPFNCFTTINQLIHEKANHTKLFRIEAEPPTVTAQRLKALTTGTLPTFIDIGSNLNSSAVTEDNIIDQLRVKVEKGNQSLVVLGDDTWFGLFPKQFNHVHVYPSFNTRDLTTVDDGIISHLFDYLGTNISNNKNSNSWRFLVAHFLGVDHIGHTYHAFHPKMIEKLKSMNQLLSQVIDSLPPNTLLCVFGDHGMTNEGEHGGSSNEEIYSGLFLYSTKPLAITLENTTNIFQSDNIQTISQIDLVPTISLLLNLSIPFSSLGKLIPEMIPLDEKLSSHPSSMLSLHAINAYQIFRYLVTYFKIDDPIISKLQACQKSTKCQINSKEFLKSFYLLIPTFPDSIHSLAYLYYDAFEAHFLENLNSIEQHDQIIHKYQKFLRETQTIMKIKWTQYNFNWIGISLLIQCCVILLLGSFYTFDTILLMIQNHSIAICLMIIHLLTPFSNSFVVEEWKLIFYGCQSFLLFPVLLFLLSEHQDNNKSTIFYSTIFSSFAFSFPFKTLHWIQSEYYAHETFPLIPSLTLSQFLVIGFTITLWYLISKFITYPSISIDTTHPYPFPRFIHILFFLLLTFHHISLWKNHFISMIDMNFELIIPQIILTFLVLSFLNIIISQLILTKPPIDQSWILYVFILIGLYNDPFQYFIFLALTLLGISSLHYLFPCSEAKPLNYLSFVVYLIFISRLVYYFTRHSFSFNSLQLHVGFVGIEEFQYYYAGFALIINTFAHELLPFLLLEIYFSTSNLPSKQKNFHKQMLRENLFIYRIMLLFTNSLAITVLCRHLMLWAIFAPKLLFEMAMFFIFSFFFLLFSSFIS